MPEPHKNLDRRFVLVRPEKKNAAIPRTSDQPNQKEDAAAYMSRIEAFTRAKKQEQKAAQPRFTLPRYTSREVIVAICIGIFVLALFHIERILPSAMTMWIAGAIFLLIAFVLYVGALGRTLTKPTTPSAASIFVMFALSVLMPIVGLGLACCALSSSENRHLGMPFLLAAMFAFAIYFAGAYLGGAFTGAN